MVFDLCHCLGREAVWVTIDVCARRLSNTTDVSMKNDADAVLSVGQLLVQYMSYYNPHSRRRIACVIIYFLLLAFVSSAYMFLLLSSLASAVIMANLIHMAPLSLLARDEFTANGFCRRRS